MSYFNVLLKKPKGLCITPYFDKVTNMPHPCGHCVHCRAQKKVAWSSRVIADYYAYHQKAIFLTLDYQDAYLPNARPVYNEVTGECYYYKSGLPRLTGDLCRPHANNFLMKFRSKFKRKYGFMPEIKYFLVGEYGSRFGRPHYHALILGLDINQVEVMELLKSCWSYGRCTIEKPRNAEHCIKYISSYLFDSIGSKSQFMDTYKVSQTPFCNVSKGFGKALIEHKLKEINDNAKRLNITPAEVVLNNLWNDNPNKKVYYHCLLTYNNAGKIERCPRYVVHKVLEAIGLRKKIITNEVKCGFRYESHPEITKFFNTLSKENLYRQLLHYLPYIDKENGLDKIEVELKEWQARMDFYYENKMYLLNLPPPPNPYNSKNILDKYFTTSTQFEYIYDKPYNPRNAFQFLYYEAVKKQKEILLHRWRNQCHIQGLKRKDIAGQALA